MRLTRTHVVAVMVVVVISGPGAAAATAPTVTVDAPQSVEVGQTVSAQLVVNDVTDAQGVGSYKINITYDSSVLAIEASGTNNFQVQTSHPEDGKIVIVGYTSNNPGPTGDVTLASLSITGKSSASSAAVDVSVASFTDADGNHIDVSVSDETIEVTAKSTDGDRQVNPNPGGGGSTGGDGSTDDGSTDGPSGGDSTQPPSQVTSTTTTSTTTATTTTTSGTTTTSQVTSTTTTSTPTTSGTTTTTTGMTTTTTGTEPTTTNGRSPGFGPSVVVVSLVLLAYIARRQH